MVSQRQGRDRGDSRRSGRRQRASAEGSVCRSGMEKTGWLGDKWCTSVQDGVSAAHRAVLDEKLRDEEKLRGRLTALTTRLQQSNKEAVAMVCDDHLSQDPY